MESFRSTGPPLHEPYSRGSCRCNRRTELRNTGALEACQSTTRVRCAHTNSVCCLLPPLSQRTMPSDATSDQAIDALQRQLASSRQLASRLENELSNAKSDLATSRLKLANSQAELQNSRAALQKERNRPEPPPPPPPPPRPISPGYERAKAAAAAATHRATAAETDLRQARTAADELRAQISALEAELSRRSEPPSRDKASAALQRVRFDLERTRRELDEERERRRSAERQLEDARKGGAGGPLRVVEAPPPPRGYTDSDREYDSLREEERRRRINELDGKIGKLEERKMSHEQVRDGAY